MTWKAICNSYVKRSGYKTELSSVIKNKQTHRHVYAQKASLEIYTPTCA